MISELKPFDRARSSAPNRHWLRRSAIVLGLIVVVGLAWFGFDRVETTRLARDTRIVVRCPDSFIDRLTPDEIREELPIQVTAGKLEVTGTANVVGRVSIQVLPHEDERRSDDAVIHVRVTGESTNDLAGVQSQVQLAGDGFATFEASKRVHFDGRTFTADDDTHVEAVHETEITEIQPLSATPLQGAVRLLASRNARAMLPDLNRLAESHIEDMVRDRVDSLIAETVVELNQINRFDEAIARLHPNFERWRIAVATRDGFVQAALVPEGGRMPTLPREPATLEVWIRLTRTQRAGVNLAAQWRGSHRLFRDFVSEEQARRLADELVIAKEDEWTCLRIGKRVAVPDRL